MQTPDERSPLGLIQEDYRGDPWRIGVISILLNVSSGARSRPIIEKFFEKYPTPRSVSESPESELEALFSSTGLGKKKTERVLIFSRRVMHPWDTVEDLPYLGPYGRDNFSIFVDGVLVDEPSDKELKKFVEWAKSWHASRT
jgi:methyl-CpG-binding domain protein 4